MSEIEELRAQVKALQERLRKLEGQPMAATTRINTVRDMEEPEMVVIHEHGVVYAANDNGGE